MTCNTANQTTPATLVVAPLVDPVVESRGFRPTSRYVEVCWLPLLGPTSTWLYRRLAQAVEDADEATFDATDLAASLGLGRGLGRQAPLSRSLRRLVGAGAARCSGRRLLIRRALAPLTATQASQLTPSARRFHEQVTAAR